MVSLPACLPRLARSAITSEENEPTAASTVTWGQAGRGETEALSYFAVNYLNKKPCVYILLGMFLGLLNQNSSTDISTPLIRSSQNGLPILIIGYHHGSGFLCRNDKVFNIKISLLYKLSTDYRCTILFRSWSSLQRMENHDLITKVSTRLKDTARNFIIQHG